jgi:fructose-1,6-bisphosphatase/inositol monophosphatase family enzyme
VSVGLVVDGVPSVGVIHDPMRGETFAADLDGPAVLGRATVHASDKDKLGDCVVSLALGGRAVATRVRAIRKAIRCHATWARRRSPGLRRQRALRCVHPVRRDVGMGRRRGRA